MKKLYFVIIAVAVLGWLAIGLVIAQGPQPEIIVPAEVITKVGPLNISNTLITSWVVMAVLIILSILATRSMQVIPSGLQNFAEAAVGFLVDQIEEIAGRENGRRFFMVTATIFLYIIVSNWFGLLPFFNAIGKTEDVGHHIFHEIEVAHTDQVLMGCEGPVDEGAEDPLVNCEKMHFAAWYMDGSSSFTYVKPRAKDTEFEIHAGEDPAVSMDRYIVFLAEEFTDFEGPAVAEAEGAEEGAPSAETVRAALAALEAEEKAPKILSESGGEHESHAVPSAALGEELQVSGVSFEDSQKLALIIPYFRGTFSDINNTLAMGIIAFLCIEFWGFQVLGFGYLKKFFNLNGINSFVGILELLSEFIRIISFAFRLFGNIFAGEVLILMLTFLMPFLVVDVIYGLELFVGFIQAAVFALLTLVFAVGAVEHHGDEEHDEGHGHEGGAEPHHEAGAVQAH